MSAVTDNAQRLRTDLRKARKAGRLPGIPEAATLSVRSESYSQGSTITIAVAAPDGWVFTGSDLSEQARALGVVLTGWLREYVGYSCGDVLINNWNAGFCP